ncbi:MAG: glycosyltransferase [Clostridia bacterium]|nr:glycosyltransferase [Clostridia bacterium]
MMVLQELLFPAPDLCGAPEMYFRSDGAVPARDTARLEKGASISADTFFNAFSVGKWRGYTRLDNLSLRLEVEGAARVALTHIHAAQDGAARSVLAERALNVPGGGTVELAFPGPLPEDGLLAFALTAEGEGAVLRGGSYCTKVNEAELNDVDIAIDICTYRREAYVEGNLALLNETFLNNPDSELRKHLEIYVSDNGQTLEAARLESDRVHIFKNRNTGGAGGFARGMLEIMDSPRRFSHVLLMDDDVLISADALLRTYRLLRLLRAEFAGKTIAGSLMRLDARHVQYESGAVWDGLEPRPRKENLDLRTLKNVLENEREERLDFNGWWYSCVPMAKIRPDNLPLPVFVHRDDVEFGLRTGSDILTLNGICVWHESFDNRYSSSMVYYETRNDLILNALHRPRFSGMDAVKLMARKLIVNVIRYRYHDCERVLKGVDDFCAGADFLMGADAEALNRQIMGNAYRFEPVEKLEIPFDERQYLDSLEKGKTRKVMLRVLFLNGLFLPAQGTNVVNAATCWPRTCYRKKALLNYDRTTDRGFVTRRSFAKSISMVLRMIGRALRLLRCYPAAAESYHVARGQMTSREFWTGYLNL